MALKKLSTLSTKTVHKNPYWDYQIEAYTLPTGNGGEYHIVHTPGSSMVVPIDDEGKLILVRQFRYLWKRESIEFPAGGMKDSDPLVTAKNELAEEANLAAANWRLVGEYNPFNGVTDEVARVYFASGLSHTSKERDESEEFEVVKMTIAEFEAAIEEGRIWDGMTLAAWMLVRPVARDYVEGLAVRK